MAARSEVATPTRRTIKHKTGRGIRVQGQAKTILCNVYDYFNKLHKKGRSDGPFKRTADATSEQYLLYFLE